jgi:pre-mRNA-splicing factor 38A
MNHRADASSFRDPDRYHGPMIRGQPPYLLLDKTLRDRIFDSYYWREQCFGLNAATMCDRVVDLTSIGGTYGLGKASPFLCLLFKMLLLVPETEIAIFMLKQGGDDWKYLRALAALYIRLTCSAKDIYELLEPLLEDYRKLRRRTKNGWGLTTVDAFVDDLLTKDRVCGVSLWKLPGRQQLEDLELLEERISPLAGEVEALDLDEENGVKEEEEDFSEEEVGELRPEEVQTKPEEDSDSDSD